MWMLVAFAFKEAPLGTVAKALARLYPPSESSSSEWVNFITTVNAALRKTGAQRRLQAGRETDFQLL